MQKRAILAKPYEQVAQTAERTRARYAKLKPPPSFAPIQAATINLFVTLRDTHVQHAKVWRTGKKADIKADSDRLAKRCVAANDHLQKVVAEVARSQGQDAELIKALRRMK